jgi:hypothetical protein
MSDEAQGPGWWQDSDEKWYPPEQHPDAVPTADLPPPPPSSPPPPPSPSPSLPPPPAGPPPIDVDPGPSRPRWVPWVAGGAALVLVIAVVAAIVAGGSGDDDMTGDDGGAIATDPITTDDPSPPDTTPPEQTDTDQDGSESGGAPVTTETATTVTTTAVDTTVATTAPPETTDPVSTTTPPVPSDGPTCRFVELDSFDDIQIEVEFSNPLGAVGSLMITYALADGGGTRFTTGTSFVDFPRADERFRISQDTLTSLPNSVTDDDVSCEVVDIEEGFGADTLEQSASPSGCEFVEVDSFDDIQVELTVTNPFPTTENLRIVYALRAGDGIRFADSMALVDLVASGETVRIDEDTFTEAPAWTTADDVRCEILGVEMSGF